MTDAEKLAASRDKIMATAKVGVTGWAVQNVRTKQFMTTNWKDSNLASAAIFSTKSDAQHMCGIMEEHPVYIKEKTHDQTPPSQTS